MPILIPIAREKSSGRSPRHFTSTFHVSVSFFDSIDFSVSGGGTRLESASAVRLVEAGASVARLVARLTLLTRVAI